MLNDVFSAFNSKSIWKVFFSVSVKGQVVSGRNIKAISTAEVTATLGKVTVAGSTDKYSDFIAVKADIDASFKLTDLGFVVLKEKVAKSQFTQFASAIKIALREQSAGECVPMCICVLSK